jgi:hypothetical protein
MSSRAVLPNNFSSAKDRAQVVRLEAAPVQTSFTVWILVQAVGKGRRG